MKVKCMFSSQFNLCNKNRNGLLKTFPQLQKLLCAFYIITKLCPQTKNYPQRTIACGTKSNTRIWGLGTGLNSVIKLVSCRQVHVQKGKTYTQNMACICTHVSPYRHSEEMIKKLESAGLGFYVRATETQQKLGLCAVDTSFSSPALLYM